MEDKDIYEGFKLKLIMELFEMRLDRLSQEQIDALYKRLMESDDGNVIIPEADNGFDAKEKPVK